MSRDLSPCIVFIGHSFAPRCNSYVLHAFRETMQAIEREVNSASEASGAPRVAFVTEIDGQGQVMRAALLRVLAEARLGVIDISDNNPNVLFELGHLAARGVPLMILKSEDSFSTGYKIPVYVDPKDVESYAHVGDVKAGVTRWLRAQMRLAMGAGAASGLPEAAL
ncbi:MAG: hypothetical protein ABUL73_00240 [Alphaproteobacteria bacterium]